MCGIVGAIANRDVVPAADRWPEAAGIPRLRLGRHRGARRRGRAPRAPHRPRRRDGGRRAGAKASMPTSASATPAGPPTAASPNPMRIRTSAMASWRWCTTASSRTTRRSAQRLQALGYEFDSQTDTEVIAHLIHHYRAQGGEPAGRAAEGGEGTARRLRDGGDRPARSGHAGRRAHGLPAAGRPGRGRELRRLRRLGDRLGDAPGDLPGRGRHRRADPRRRAACSTRTTHRSRARCTSPTCRWPRWNWARTATSCRRKSTNSRARSATPSRRIDRCRRLRRRRCSARTRPACWRDVEAVQILACGTSYYAGLTARYWIEAHRRPAVRGRHRQRVPLPQRRWPTRSSWSSPSRSPAKPWTRWRR